MADGLTIDGSGCSGLSDGGGDGMEGSGADT
jgi:hypothetical protein